MKFSRMLPKLLTRTDVVLELRDSRLPLTSINGTLEGSFFSPASFYKAVTQFLVTHRRVKEMAT